MIAPEISAPVAPGGVYVIEVPSGKLGVLEIS
jgi:hypothetical protein